MNKLRGGRRRQRTGRTLAALAAFALMGAVSPESPVADAAMRGSLTEVRALLADGADVNASQGDGMTALHWAADRGDVALGLLLIDAGASVEARTRIGAYTPLHLASRAGEASLVVALLDAGADGTARTTTGGAQPIHFAAASPDGAVVRALIANGADPDARDEALEQTPLMFAAGAGRIEPTKALLEAGADVSLTSRVVDVAERAKLDRVAQQERNRRVRASYAARVAAATGATEPEKEEPKDAGPKTPDLQESYEQVGRMQEDVEPLSYGQLVGGQGGLAALHYAVRQGHAEVAHTIVDAGAHIDQTTLGDGSSPLLMASINGYFDLALELLERGADPTVTSHAGTTPLFAVLNTHWAPKSRYPQQMAYRNQEADYLQLMKAFLDAGADPNQRLTKHLWYLGYNFDLLQIDVAGATPFWRAAYSLDIPAMRLLVEYGADPAIPTQKTPERRFRRGPATDGTDPSGLPPVEIGGPAVYPIQAAAGVGHGEGFAGNAHRHVPDGWVPAARYLVEELGADVNSRDHNGYSALHHAAARGDVELIQYLVDQGADVSFVSRRGQTTADMANGPVQRVQPWPEALQLLEQLGAVNNHNCVSCE